MTLSLNEVLQELRLDPRFAERVSAWQYLPARPGAYAQTPSTLDSRVLHALGRRGIQCLYSHQTQAIAAVLRGEDVAVVAGAAAGKTLCYNLPVLHTLLREPQARALYLFPTKALAQDQLAAWQELSAGLLNEDQAATYDGDTPTATRTRVREGARVLITNPDMLHVGILPHHPRWQAFFTQLRFVVLDEMHAYRGVFGSQVANLLRRLRRVCAFYDAHPQFILCSATIANPQELAQRLIERPVTLVDNDGAPHGERHWILYNPPLVDSTQGMRRSLLLETASVADRFLAHDLPTIVFSHGRLTTELLLTYLRRSAKRRGEPVERIRGYRGGYLPRERRAIEHGLREGHVRGVVSTNALELGVDIGDLSVCVLAGYPGTIASTWQQAGRAGRRRDVSLTVLVAGPTAVDQYLLSHPQFFFSRTPEQALIAPDNPYLLRSHLQCAAFELPLEECESLSPNVDTLPIAQDVAAHEGVLRQARGRWYWMSSRYPSQDVSLRTATSDNWSVVQADSGQVIGQVDSPSAPLLIHPGAIYLHEGQTYQIEAWDATHRAARAQLSAADYFTEASQTVQVHVLQATASQTAGTTSRGHGDVRVRSQVTQFKRLAWYTHELLSIMPLELPEQEMLTNAYWLGLQPELVNALRDQGDWTIAPILSYGPNWDEQRRRTRERDDYRCRHCGRQEAPGREHDVHHLRPFRTFDYRPGINENYRSANELSNLVTLCPDCHRRLETAYDTQGTLDGLAHLLHALAPLRLMCDPRDLGVSAELDFAFTRLPSVVIYDAVPGGVGFSAALYALHDELLHDSLDWLMHCPCDEGCPACIGAPPEPGLGAKRRVQALLNLAAA